MREPSDLGHAYEVVFWPAYAGRGRRVIAGWVPQMPTRISPDGVPLTTDDETATLLRAKAAAHALCLLGDEAHAQTSLDFDNTVSAVMWGRDLASVRVRAHVLAHQFRDERIPT